MFFFKQFTFRLLLLTRCGLLLFATVRLCLTNLGCLLLSEHRRKWLVFSALRIDGAETTNTY
jgi:hypothetical protein